MVAERPGAIGYIGIAYLSVRVKPLRVSGVMGSLGSARDGSYPICRPLFMFTRSWPQGTVQDFIRFVQDPERGQKIIDQAGYLPRY